MCVATLSVLTKTSYVNPMQSILHRYTKTLCLKSVSLYQMSSTVCEESSSRPKCFVWSFVPDCRQWQGFSWQASGRGKLPSPHWAQRMATALQFYGDMSQGLMFRCISCTPVPFRSLFIGRSWLRHFSLPRISLYY